MIVSRRFRQRLAAGLVFAILLNIAFVVGEILPGGPPIALLPANLTGVFLGTVGLLILLDAPRRWAVRHAGRRKGYVTARRAR
jgi:hypothetical protein